MAERLNESVDPQAQASGRMANHGPANGEQLDGRELGRLRVAQQQTERKDSSSKLDQNTINDMDINRDFQNRLLEMDKQEDVLSVMDNQSVFGNPAGGMQIRNFQHAVEGTNQPSTMQIQRANPLAEKASRDVQFGITSAVCY